ncbi:MAG: TonB-dependent receptor, partial [Pseudohongiellaceae bacterium]
IQHFLPGLPIEDNEHRSLGLQMSGYHSLSENANLAIGLDLESTNGRLQEFQERPTAGSAFLVGTIPVGKHYDYEVDATQIAPFVQYHHYFANGWDMTLGLRYEQMDYEYDNQMIDGRVQENGVPCGFGGCRFNRPADRDDDYGDWSPKFGLRYRINDLHTFSTRLQKGFRAPQATELYRLQNNQTVADLDSVEIDSFEVALEGAGSNWEYSVTGFYMDKQNEIVTDSGRLNLNDSDTRHKGVELAGAYELADNLTFFAAFNYARHTYEKDLENGALAISGNDVDSAPKTFGNFRLQWRPIDSVLTELEWVNMGDYYSNPENTADYEGHDVFNLRTSWEINSSLNLSLNILNITDEKYAERADWTSFGGDRYFVGEPVRAFLSLNWDMN